MWAGATSGKQGHSPVCKHSCRPRGSLFRYPVSSYHRRGEMWVCHSAEDSSLVKLFQFAFNSLPAHHCCIQDDIAIAASPKSHLKLFVSYTNSIFTITIDERKSSKVFDFMNKGFRLGHYRSAAADPRFKIAPLVLRDLSRNFVHRATLRVDGQAGRPKVKRATKRNASNGEYNTSSRYNGIQRASRTTCGGSVTAVRPSDDGGNSNPPILSL